MKVDRFFFLRGSFPALMGTAPLASRDDDSRLRHVATCCDERASRVNLGRASYRAKFASCIARKLTVEPNASSSAPCASGPTRVQTSAAQSVSVEPLLQLTSAALRHQPCGDRLASNDASKNLLALHSMHALARA